jgi:predicted phage terminase large subunit-like protein
MDKRALARQELARRALARRDLLAFTWYTWHQYQAARVHAVLARALESVELYVRSAGSEGTGRLLVLMPPRHGKSELVSRRLPAWFLGRNPDKRVLLTSCTADLANGFSRQARDIVRSAAFQRLWGQGSGRPPGEWVQVSRESRAASAWELERHRGGLVSAGVGGSIIGRGAHLAIIDDPFKSREDAERQSVRDKVDDWYRSTLYTRLERGGAIVLMHQRWHADDLAGRLIRKMTADASADRWRVLSLPALAEVWAEGVGPEEALKAARSGWWMASDAMGRAPGESLWPEKFSVEDLGRIKTNVGLYEWAALYQQRPQPMDGALIPTKGIIRVTPDEVPELVREVRYWDLAVSGSERADWIAGARVGRAADRRTYITHVAHLPGPWVDARPKIVWRMLDDPARVTQGIEISGQQGGYYQEFKTDEDLALRAIEPVNPREVGSKEVRAQVWASRIQDGLIHVVDDGTWNVDGFLSECLAFPNGTYDDQVDSVSGAMQMLGGWSGGLADVPQDLAHAGVWGELDFGGLLEEVGPWRLG